jgi:glycosyltransferase involved in cell wall biosynthesis
MMIKAFSNVLMQHNNAVLIMVGDGDERENIEQLVNELGIADKVIFTGYNPNPQHYLALMDVYLLSSFSEGTSMTLLEAMSLGKACIVTDAGGNAEIIQHNVNGLVSENANLEQFSENCIQLINDERQLKLFAVESRRIYEKQFSLNNMLIQYTRLYTNEK